MKRILLTSFIAALGLFSAIGQTNAPAAPTDLKIVATNAATLDPQAWELTLSGGGLIVPKTGDKEASLDVSLETNPFESVRSLWFGVEQQVAWEPMFAGATDGILEWSFHLVGQLYLNTGWTAGAAYDTSSSAIWRTGPEANLQFFVGNSAYIFGGLNYHIVSKGDNELIPSLGIGMTW